MTGAIILQVVLIFLNAIFASAEIAVISMSETKLNKMAEEGDRRAGRLVTLTANPAKFLATIQVAITMAGFLGSAYAADSFAEPLVAALVKTGIGVPESVLNSICVFLITLIIAYFSIVFGELIPKRAAMQKKEAMALGLSGILTVVSKIFAPIVWLLTASTNGVLKALGIDPDQGDEVTEEEIRMMVAAGSEKGAIDREENDFIQNVFEFDDTGVEEICTHRMDMELLKMEESQEEWDEAIYSSKHSYYPVCGANSDDIIGILDAKIYLRMKDRNRDAVMAQAVKKPYFVPESMKADVLFRNMKKSGNYFAVVIDEYGGMSGIVTIRDLLEALVGDLYQEGGEAVPDIRQVSENEWLIRGCASLDDVAQELKRELPVEEYDTFSGFICGILDEIPADGAKFALEAEGMKIQVKQVKDRKIEEALVICLSAAEKH